MRSLLLILVIVLLRQTAFGVLAEKDGYYITLEGDTVHGTIKIRIDYNEEPYYFMIQYGAYYQDSLGNLTALTPDGVSSFTFFHEYAFVKFVSLEYYNNYRLFLHAINEEGDVKLYAHYKNVVDTRTDFGSLAYYLLEYPASSEQDYFFLTKSDGNVLKYSKYSGKKNIARFFSDYPELHSKIERGLYGYTAIYIMVREYNIWKRDNPGGGG